MLLANRRIALIYGCLAGMEAAWATPFWLLIFQPAMSPGGAFAALLAALLAWMLVLELLSRADVRSPRYELLTLGLMAATSLLAVRLLLYRGWPLLDLGWLGRMVADIARFQGGAPPGLALLAGNLFLWQRATAATSRDLSFFNVGVSFRSGVLLLIAGAGALAVVRGQTLTAFVWLYFGLGLIAVAVARISEKASEAQSAGEPLPPRRLGQLLAAVGVTVGAAWLFSFVFTPAGIRSFLRLFDPLWVLVRPLFYAALLVLARIVNPMLLWLEAKLTALLAENGFSLSPGGAAIAPQAKQTSPIDALPPWLPTLLANLAIAVGIAVAVLVVIGFLLLYLERVRGSKAHPESEEEGREAATFGGGILGRGAHAARNLAGMIRRFGLGTRLLAAISVQNIYANVCRLAGLRGHPRPAAQPPDDYLPTLNRAFPGHAVALSRITETYMRVHYGDHPVSRAELAQIREDYRAVRESIATAA